MVLWIKTHGKILAPLLLVLASWAVYGGIVDQQFLTDWDDPVYVTANEAVRGISLANLRTAFSTTYLGNYAPVQIVSYMVDYALWGMQPFGFKLSNLLIHGLNGILFYLLLLRITGRITPALLSALIFVCHPVQVETVAWISQRKNLLAMFFFLLAYHCYLNYRAHKSCWHYVASLGTFLLALLAKPVAVIFPAVILLDDLCHGTTPRKGLFKDKIPFVLCAAAFSVIAFICQSPENQGGKTEYHGGTPWATFSTMTLVLFRYLKLLFWPEHMSAGYYIDIVTGFDLTLALAFAALAGLAAVAIVLYRTRRGLCFWYAFFFIALLPVSQIVPLVTLMNDRYLYFPLLGAATFIALLGTAGHVAAQMRVPLLGLLCIGIVALAVLARERTTVWQNSITLWRDTTVKMPRAPIAWASLGTAYLNAGLTELAIGNFRQALLIEPDNKMALSGLGAAFAQQGKLAQAEWYLLNAIKSDPANMAARVSLGTIHLIQGRAEDAEKFCREGIKLADCSRGLWVILGNIAMLKGEPAEAERCYAIAHDHPGTPHEMSLSKALMEAARGNMGEAAYHLQKAKQQEPPARLATELMYLQTIPLLPFHDQLVEISHR